MRVTSLVAGLALVLAACGGEKKAENQAAATDTTTAAPTAAAPAATGATHDVDMVMDGTQPKFVPATLTVKSGDVIRFHNKSGGPHSVNFWADSIPANAKSAITVNPSTGGEPLDSDLMNEPDGIITVTFNNAPAGEYKIYCLPHLAMGMKGVITVQQ
ncbi:MAG: plastocyanin/azurin family copper-binding protein [Bacillota bacterium]|jgi:plastocyanin